MHKRNSVHPLKGGRGTQYDASELATEDVSSDVQPQSINRGKNKGRKPIVTEKTLHGKPILPLVQELGKAYQQKNKRFASN